MGAFARAHRHRCYCGCYTNISLSWISNFIASRWMTSSSNQHALPFFFFCLHHFHLGILDAEELTHLVHVLLLQQAPLKIVLPDVLVSSHRIVAAMLLTGASCGIVMTSIPWVAGIFDWLHFHPHARLLHAACQGKLCLSHILLRSRVLVSCLQDATMAIALHNRNALSTCVPVKRYLYHPFCYLLICKDCLHQVP